MLLRYDRRMLVSRRVRSKCLPGLLPCHVLTLWFALTTTTAFAASPPSAKAFESRLYAPCCYGGTLDTHDSDLARDLRREIEQRLERGEASVSIQDDLVSRYGEKMLAARSEKPIEFMTLALGAGLVAAAIASWFGLRRLIVRGRSLQPAGTTPALSAADVYDSRLDDALAELDSQPGS